MRQIIKDLIEKQQLIIPNWGFDIGEGSDIIQTLHYYAIGDPINLFCVFVPVKYMWVFYDFTIIFRLYLAGIGFSHLCFYFGKFNKTAVLAGAFTYMFNTWSIWSGPLHPFFLTPLVYLPFMILGVEKVLNHEKPYVFVISTVFAVASNFYFFYMLVVFTVLYVLLRLVGKCGKNYKMILREIFRVSIHAIHAAFIAGIIVAPVLYTFLHDRRLGGDMLLEFVYHRKYYELLIHSFVSLRGDKYISFGYYALSFLAVFLLLKKKEDTRFLKISLLIFLLIMTIPLLTQLLNGMANKENRWCWALALLQSYILVYKWDNLLVVNLNEKKYLLRVACIYLLLVTFTFDTFPDTLVAVCIMFINLIILCNKELFSKREIKEKILCGIVFFNGFVMCFFAYSYNHEGKVTDFIPIRNIEELFHDNSASALMEAGIEKDIVRFASSEDSNESFLQNCSSTGYYWSLSSPETANYRKSLETNEYMLHRYSGYDDRVNLLTLAAVNYIVYDESNHFPTPYGYTFVCDDNPLDRYAEQRLDELAKIQNNIVTDEQKEVINKNFSGMRSIYKNEFALPLTYTYEQYISSQTWNSLSAISKQENMLKYVYLSDKSDNCQEAFPTVIDYSVPFTAECKSYNTVIKDGKIITTAPNQTIKLSFKGKDNSELYIRLEGLDFYGTSSYDMYFGNEETDPLNLYNEISWEVLDPNKRIEYEYEKKIWKPVTETKLSFHTDLADNALTYYTIHNNWYNGRHDFVINLGYSETPVEEATITFGKQGIYNLSKLEVICYPMNDFAATVAERKEDCLQNPKIGVDTIKGTIDLDSPKILCLAVPYSEGWKAYDNGQEAKVLLANEHYMAIDVDAGHHEIEFAYSTPFLKEGAWLTAIGLMLLVFEFLYDSKKIKCKKNE